MDHSKKTKLPANKKSIRTTETAFLNYVFSKSQDKQKKFKLLEDNLLGRKQNEPHFDVNDLMGFSFQHKSKMIHYFYEVCFYDDDVELFRLLMKLGLKNTCARSICMNTWFFQFNAFRCLKEVFIQPEISEHFLIGEDSPIFSAISTYNQDILKTMCLHSQFKAEYFTQVTTHQKNPMQAAADAFNSEALDFLIQRNAPHIRATNGNHLASFDVACNRFLDFFSGKKFINYFRGQLNLSPVTHHFFDLFDQKHIALENVIKVFYLLLNNTTQYDFNYQLCVLPEKDCNYIFDLLNNVATDLKFKDAPMKLLLDILLSTGPGIFFTELPDKLQAFYRNIPLDAEMVLPVLQKDNKTFQYFYFFKEFKAYLDSNLTHFKIAKGMIQYIECRQKIQFDETGHLFLQEIESSLSAHPEVQRKLKQEPIMHFDMGSKDKNFVHQMYDVLKIMIPEKTNLMFLVLQYEQLKGISTRLVDRQKFDKMKLFEKEFDKITTDNESALKDLYVKWIILDKIFQQGISCSEESTFSYFREAYEQFLNSIKKIDYYSMITLYAYLNMKLISTTEKIELLTFFLLFIKSLKIRNSLKKNSEEYHSFLRLEFVLHALLIQAYQENNQSKLAKKELEQCILIMRAKPCGKLFYGLYQGKAHQILVFQAFDNVTSALIALSKPADLIRWLDQIKEYQLSALFPDMENQNTKSLANYIIKTIDTEQFDESMHLIEMLPCKNDFLIEYQDIKINELLKRLECDVSELGLDFCISINVSKKRLELDYEKIGCSFSKIKKELSIDLKVEQEKIIIEQVHLLDQNQVMNMLECIQKKRHAVQRTKLAQKTDSTSMSISEVDELLVSPMHYLSLYEHNNHNKRQKIKKGKVEQSESQESTSSEEKVSNKKNRHKVFDIDRSELKKLAGIDNTYTDLVMIKNHCSFGSKRFLAIKNLPQFQSFLSVCYVDVKNKNQFSVDSINPYGENQHGVKYVDVKNGAEKEYKIKIKSSGSERMVGLGKEVYQAEKKFIVYQADIVLSHKKSEKLFKP